MEVLINQIEVAQKQGLYMLCLYSTLTLPDIAGAIDSQNGRANGAKYAQWFDEFAAPNLAHLTGAECYFYRCRVLHQGISEADANAEFDQIGFMEPSPNLTIQIGKVVSGSNPVVRVIDLNTFVDAVLTGWKEWVAIRKGSEPFESNYDKCMKRHPNGYLNVVQGHPFII